MGYRSSMVWIVTRNFRHNKPCINYEYFFNIHQNKFLLRTKSINNIHNFDCNKTSPTCYLHSCAFVCWTVLYMNDSINRISIIVILREKESKNKMCIFIICLLYIVKVIFKVILNSWLHILFLHTITLYFLQSVMSIMCLKS